MYFVIPWFQNTFAMIAKDGWGTEPYTYISKSGASIFIVYIVITSGILYFFNTKYRDGFTTICLIGNILILVICLVSFGFSIFGFL